ncbi:MAG: hypothetical protein ABIG39_04580 [Candidatus Micrarchaeota archaeon]
MEVSLCGGESCCPMVKVRGKGIEIGEKGNLVKLNADEWNTLVDFVKSGKLNRI